MKNYKAKAEFYVRQHQDHIAITKLKTDQPLTETDIESLEQILWKELGSKDDYEKEYGHKPLVEFVREIVGLDIPFTDKGSVVEIFTDLTVWMEIRRVIDQINANAVA